jgi:hypothetical protein
MKRKFKKVFWAIGLGLLMLVANAGIQKAFAKDASWGAISDANRFQPLQNYNNEAVLDRETGLVWQKTPNDGNVGSLNPPTTFGSAKGDCVTNQTGGRSGWRLPTVYELMSLRDSNSSFYPTIPHNIFQSVSSTNHYWSSTSFGSDPNSVYTVNFIPTANGAPYLGADKQTGTASVWCVRGGTGSTE